MSSKQSCPYCNKQFIKLNEHITKSHTTYYISVCDLTKRINNGVELKSKSTGADDGLYFEDDPHKVYEIKSNELYTYRSCSQGWFATSKPPKRNKVKNVVVCK